MTVLRAIPDPEELSENELEWWSHLELGQVQHHVDYGNAKFRAGALREMERRGIRPQSPIVEGSTYYHRPEDLVFLPLPSVDGYRLEWPRVALRMQVERLRRDRQELMGELAVECDLRGKSPTSRLSVGDFNLSSVRARSERAKVLGERLPGLDWVGLLEDLCQRVIEGERTGRPAVALREVERVTEDEDAYVDGVRILRRHPMIVFGAGGDLKSLIALYWATELAEHGLRVLYADWEFSAEEHRDRLERITGPDMPDGVLYVRCERPMTAEADRLRRIVLDERIDYLVCDSVAFAVDGPPESAEIAAGYFRGLRRIGIGSLNIAHITKGDGGDRMPFGSAFWANGARSTWFAKRSDEAGVGPTRVALFNRKSNVGPLAPAVGYAVSFEDGRIAFDRTDVATMTDLASRLPIGQRINAVLKSGAMTVAEIASELDEKVDSVAKAVRRGESKVYVRTPGPDGVYRIGLLARDAA